MRANIFLGKVMQPRRTVARRLFRSDHRRQLFIVDMNPAQRRFCRRTVQCRHRRHRLAGENNPAASDDRLVFVFAAPHVVADVVEIFAGQHCDDSGHRFGVGRIDRADARMGVRTAQKLAFNHSRHVEIGNVLRPAGDFISAIDARHRVADDGKATFVSVHQSGPFQLEISVEEIAAMSLRTAYNGRVPYVKADKASPWLY